MRRVARRGAGRVPPEERKLFRNRTKDDVDDRKHDTKLESVKSDYRLVRLMLVPCGSVLGRPQLRFIHSKTIPVTIPALGAAPLASALRRWRPRRAVEARAERRAGGSTVRVESPGPGASVGRF